MLADFRYLSDGTKIGVKDAAGNGYEYLGSLIYRRTPNGLEIESTDFAGGRILKTSAKYDLRYFVRDYLGSVRAIVNAQGQRLEAIDYMPYGSRWKDPMRLVTDNRYLFNGKEWQPTGDLDVLDYGARQYDPELGRWFNPDPVMQFLNPYTFCANDPVNLVDPDGRRLPIKIGDGEYRWDKIGGHWGYYDEDDKPYKGNDPQVKQLTKTLKRLIRYSGFFRDMIKDLVESPEDVFIECVTSAESSFDSTTNTVVWLSISDPNITVHTEDGISPYNPAYGLAHELGHAWNKVMGKRNLGEWLSDKIDNFVKSLSWDEVLVTHYENIIRSEHGDPLRIYYYPNEPLTQIVDGDRRNIYIDVKGELHYGMIFHLEERYPY